ncbi:MAG: energy transducer TonB [Saprospiraceae bacterium]
MSIQNSTRLFLLFALLVSLGQLGFAQQSEADFAYANTYAANINSSDEFTSSNTMVEPKVEKSTFDFSQGVRFPHFVALGDYVTQHLVYPEVATAYAVEGSVVLSLKLSSTGEVLSAAVVKPLGFGCDEAAFSLVNKMPNWTPASNYGVAVGAKQLVTVDFKLQ